MSVADELTKLNDLRVGGVLTPEEYEAAKAALIDAPARAAPLSAAGPAPPNPAAVAPLPAGEDWRTRCASVMRYLIVAEAALSCLHLPLGVAGGLVADGVARERGVVVPESTPTQDAAMLMLCATVGVALPALVASWVGMYRLRAWSRWLYLGVTALITSVSAAASLTDFSFEWGFPHHVESLSTLVTGGILALAFASPAAESFTGGDGARAGADAAGR